jgi:hypothetical protein
LLVTGTVVSAAAVVGAVVNKFHRVGTTFTASLLWWCGGCRTVLLEFNSLAEKVGPVFSDDSTRGQAVRTVPSFSLNTRVVASECARFLQMSEPTSYSGTSYPLFSLSLLFLTSCGG